MSKRTRLMTLADYLAYKRITNMAIGHGAAVWHEEAKAGGPPAHVFGEKNELQ